MTEKQKLFADEYLIDLNATRAYRVAHGGEVKDTTCSTEGSKLLRNPKVASYIRERMSAREQRTEITADMVIAELAKIAFTDATKVAKVVKKPALDEYGQLITDRETGEPLERTTVEVVTTDELSADERASIASVKVNQFGSVEVQQYDKMKALDLLGRHLGIWNDKLQVDNVAEMEKAKKLDSITSILEQMKPTEG